MASLSAQGTIKFHQLISGGWIERLRQTFLASPSHTSPFTFLFSRSFFSPRRVFYGQSASTPYGETASKIADRGLTELRAFTMLTELTGTIGSRISGSPQAAKAVEWGKKDDAAMRI